MVMRCPHCEDNIDTVARTGENRYGCGSCNMVISYDDLEPYLEDNDKPDLEVIDKRDSSGGSSSSNNSGNSNQGQQSSQDTQQSGGGAAQASSMGPVNDRERIYQRGVDALDEIKRERLDKWLENTENAGGQTRERILMVFDNDQTVRRDPNRMYNMLSDEVKGSPSYLNTMVQNIFAPEEEHQDLLTDQGYTPWHMRNKPGMSQPQQQAPSGPRGGGAQGVGGFTPQQSSGPPQQQQHPQQHAQGQQFNQAQPQQQQQPQQTQQPRQNQGERNGDPSNNSSDSSDDSEEDPAEESITRQEAAKLAERAANQAAEQNQTSAFMEGLSNATDQALYEMASNVGGLAGTMQEVVNEALVGYARENPEWVIDNLDILQKFIGATDDMPSGGNSQSVGGESDSGHRVDAAMSQMSNDNTQQQPTRQQQHSNPQQGRRQQQSRNTQQRRQPKQSTQKTPNQQPQTQQSQQTQRESGEETNKEHLDAQSIEPEESDFDRSEADDEVMSASPEELADKYSDEVDDSDMEEKKNVEPQGDKISTQQNESATSEDETFDELFGDIAE